MKDPTWDIPEEKPEEIYPPCKVCGGRGFIELRTLGFDGEAYETSMICRECDGKGYIIPEEDEEIPY